MNYSDKPSFYNLPQEISQKIIQYLDIKNLPSTFLINKTFSDYSSKDSFWQSYFTEHYKPSEYGLNSLTLPDINNFLFRNSNKNLSNKLIKDNSKDTKVWKLFSQVVVKGRQIPFIVGGEVESTIRVYVTDTGSSILERYKHIFSFSFEIFIYDRSSCLLHIIYNDCNGIHIGVSTYRMCCDHPKFLHLRENPLAKNNVWLIDNVNLFNSEMVFRGAFNGGYKEFAYKNFFDRTIPSLLDANDGHFIPSKRKIFYR
jgi:hypothetical protein